MGRPSLRNYKWKQLGQTIPVENSFRYLGAQINVATRRVSTVIDDRFRRAAGMARRLARIPISIKAKARAINGKILPVAMYGVENSQPKEVEIKRLTTAIAQMPHR